MFGVADGAVQHQRLMADGRLTLDSCSTTGPGGQPLYWRLTLAWVGGPQPVMGRARDISAEVQARQREALLLNGLALSEDPLLVFEQNAETQEMMLAGQGEIHLKVAVEKLRSTWKASAKGKPHKMPVMNCAPSSTGAVSVSPEAESDTATRARPGCSRCV